MQTKYFELCECNLILQEKVWSVNYAFPNIYLLTSKPPGADIIVTAPPVSHSCHPCQSPHECPPGDGGLQMGVYYVCSSCSSQSVLFHFIFMCTCAYAFAVNQE